MKPFTTYIIVVFATMAYATSFAQYAMDTSTNISKKLVRPPYLEVGDTVAIVAPSGILKNREGEIQKAVQLLKSWGLNVVIAPHVFSQANHFAGTDAMRCEDLQKAMDNPNIRAIWCARGGYGSVRLLDKLDYSAIIKQPKWLIGYSDITALHSQLHNAGIQSLHAMMCVNLAENAEDIVHTVDSFKEALFGKPRNYSLESSKYNKTGRATGVLVGGNLTILHSLLGSETSIDTNGKIIFIEEIGEYKYHIDRMLQSLKRAGYFENCAGLIIGDISKIRKNTTPWGSTIEQLVLDAFSEYSFPIAFNMPAGHEKDNRALILGSTVELIVEEEQTKVIFNNF